MANNALNVLIGKPLAAGAVWFAVAGTALPTSEATAKNAAFKTPGYLSDAGITRKIAETRTDIKAYGGTIVRKVVSDHDVVYSWEMIETNEQSLNIYHGDANVDITAGGPSAGTKTVVRVKANVTVRGAWIIEYVDGTHIGRVVLPDGEVTSRGDVVATDTGVLSYPIEVTCYPDTSEVKAYEYWDDGIFIP